MKIIITIDEGVYDKHALAEIPGQLEIETNCLLGDCYSPAIKVEVVDE